MGSFAQVSFAQAPHGADEVHLPRPSEATSCLGGREHGQVWSLLANLILDLCSGVKSAPALSQARPLYVRMEWARWMDGWGPYGWGF